MACCPGEVIQCGYTSHENAGLNESKGVLERNKSVYMDFMTCPSHIIHNYASHSSKAFVKAIKCDVGDIAVDVFFWFDYSTKRKNLLAEFCQFCDRVQKDKVHECPLVES